MINRYFKSFVLCINDNDKANIKYYVKLVYNFGDGTQGFDYIDITGDEFTKFSELESIWYKEKKENEDNNNGK